MTFMNLRKENGNIMKYIRSMIVAFSLYSKIPMPIFEWRDEDLKHNLVFLPWVGALIGLLVYGISLLFDQVSIPLIFVMAVYSLVPLVVTGGFHMDGFFFSCHRLITLTMERKK